MSIETEFDEFKEVAELVHEEFLDTLRWFFGFQYVPPNTAEIFLNDFSNEKGYAALYTPSPNPRIDIYNINVDFNTKNFNTKKLTYLVSHESGHHLHYLRSPTMDKTWKQRGLHPWKEFIAETSSIIFLNKKRWTTSDFRDLDISKGWDERLWEKLSKENSGSPMEAVSFLRTLLTEGRRSMIYPEKEILEILGEDYP